MESFSELQSRRARRKRKVSNSFGVYDAYKLMRKNGWYDIGKPVSEKDYYAIIRTFNNCLAEELAMGRPVVLPARMGKLELVKQGRGVSIVNGKLKVTYPVNWSKTLQLWYEDPEAMRNKTLMRDEEKYVYRVKYNVFDATYDNKCFYQFALNTFIKKALKNNIKAGKVDTLWQTAYN